MDITKTIISEDDVYITTKIVVKINNTIVKQVISKYNKLTKFSEETDVNE